MLLSEIKDSIKKYEINELRAIIAEMYKSMPKKLREDKDIDALILDLNSHMSSSKVEKSSIKQPDLVTLKAKIELFIEYAYNQYYFAPNQFVHKKDRPKWRFIVKAFVKDLESIPYNSDNGKIATDLIQKLYEMLSYGCAYYIFNTQDPFRSAGIVQTELIDTVIKRKFLCDLSEESIKSAISLVINSKLDMETLHSSLTCVLICNLKTAIAKEMAIKQCETIKAELTESRVGKTKKSLSYDDSNYIFEEKNNHLVETIFKLQLELFENDVAISYFNKYYIIHDKEVLLYVLLQILHAYDLKEYWLREYDAAVKNGIIPREMLSEKYNYLRQNDKFPEDSDYLYN